jgi:EAL domain-containing protein (putative c-di-GMP-specific phosphodiesterase class I)
MKLHPSLTAGSLSTAKQRSCVTGLVELARLLDMDVGIKHVERATQALTLQQFKFSRMQGFLFGRALPASDFCDRFMWVSCPTELN